MNDVPREAYALGRSKKALEKYEAAHEKLKAAAGERERLEDLPFMEVVLDVMAGKPDVRAQAGDPAAPQARFAEEAEKKRWRGYVENLRDARAKEEEARAEVARATEELEEVTVEPRVEGLKLRFETRKLQATLSAGVLVGAATVTEVLLPPSPDHAFLLYAAYAAFIASLSGCIADMNRIAIYVENLLTGGRTEVEKRGWREKVSRVMMWVNQRSLAFGLALFVLFATLNLA